jgi:hypothetical protein
MILAGISDDPPKVFKPTAQIADWESGLLIFRGTAKAHIPSFN